MTPFDDFVYLINHVLLGEEPTIEDFILLVGTLVAFIAFILWCCFPIQPKPEPGQHRQFTCKIIKNHMKTFDAAPKTEENAAAAASASANGNGNAAAPASTSTSTSTYTSANANATDGSNLGNISSLYNTSGGNYSKNGTVAMHNYYVKSGHHCCT